MKQRYFCVFVVLFIAVLCQAAASERTYNVLFIQSYTSQTPWHRDLNQGLVKGFKDNGLKVNITTEYLDADFWAFRSEKVIMRRFCERARDRETDLIVTSSDEAFYTLFACGDSLPLQIPVVFFGIKYPDEKLFAAHPNVCGYTVNPDFDIILREAQRLFPKRKEVICVIDNSFLSNKGLEDFQEEWEVFQKDNPDYDMKIYNTQNQTTSHIISAICYPRNSYGRVVIAPKWSPFLSFVGKNSKAPVFATQNVGLTNGVFGAYDCDAYTSAMQAAQRASSVLKGTSPKDVGVTEIPQGFIYDYKQLEFFHVNPDKIGSKGTVVNEPYWEKYKLLFILLYPSILALLIASIVWLMRVNRREAKRRVQAQTRLLVQNKMVEQRNEFDNVFHSIRDGVITYDTDLHIHFTNRSLLQMLHLPFDIGGRVYEGMMAGSIFKIYHNGQDILPLLLKTVHDSQRLNMPAGVELVLRMPAGDKKYLTTDNVRLQQVVNNLINNAAKFTGSGFITFGYEEDEEPGYTRIFVEDTGVGISEEGIRHIFERFYKVDNFTQGAGLGLSICQTIVERLKGTISVTSEVGKGTRFTVRLPNYCE